MELIRNTYDTASVIELKIDPSRHEILHGHYVWLEWLRRVTNTPRLMLYRHKETEAFVVGVWVWSPEEARNPIVTEIRIFHDVPTRMWPRDLGAPGLLRNLLRPVEQILEDREKKRNDAEHMRIKRLQDNQDSKREAQAGLRRRGKSEEAARLDYMPWSVPCEESREFFKDTNKLVRAY